MSDDAGLHFILVGSRNFGINNASRAPNGCTHASTLFNSGRRNSLAVAAAHGPNCYRASSPAACGACTLRLQQLLPVRELLAHAGFTCLPCTRCCARPPRFEQTTPSATATSDYECARGPRSANCRCRRASKHYIPASPRSRGGRQPQLYSQTPAPGQWQQQRPRPLYRHGVVNPDHRIAATRTTGTNDLTPAPALLPGVCPD